MGGPGPYCAPGGDARGREHDFPVVGAGPGEGACPPGQAPPQGMEARRECSARSSTRRVEGAEAMNTNPSMQVEQLNDGTFRVTLAGNLPQPSISQNEKWPWTPWNVTYQRGILDKDGARLLQ